MGLNLNNFKLFLIFRRVSSSVTLFLWQIRLKLNHPILARVSFPTLYYADMVSFAVGIPVWQMVREAVNSLGGTTGRRQIIDYIESRHVHVNKGTISCQIALCTVNSPSRVHFPQNKKARKANRSYA